VSFKGRPKVYCKQKTKHQDNKPIAAVGCHAFRPKASAICLINGAIAAPIWPAKLIHPNPMLLIYVG
jgi:hypothetical protein